MLFMAAVDPLFVKIYMIFAKTMLCSLSNDGHIKGNAEGDAEMAPKGWRGDLGTHVAPSRTLFPRRAFCHFWDQKLLLERIRRTFKLQGDGCQTM